MIRNDTLFRIGMACLAGTALYMGFLWWRWLVGRMGTEHSGDPVKQLVVAAVVFIPTLLFIWMMWRLIRPSK